MTVEYPFVSYLNFKALPKSISKVSKSFVNTSMFSGFKSLWHTLKLSNKALRDPMIHPNIFKTLSSGIR